MRQRVRKHFALSPCIHGETAAVGRKCQIWSIRCYGVMGAKGSFQRQGYVEDGALELANHVELFDEASVLLITWSTIIFELLRYPIESGK